MGESSRTLTFGALVVETSSEGKAMYPGEGITKGDVIDYYRKVADHMLPFAEERFLTLQRFPEGIDEHGFFQQARPDYFPDFITGTSAERVESGAVEHISVSNAAGLVYLANQAALTLHGWQSRRGNLHHPDRLVIDLDPPDDDFTPVRHAARLTGDFLGELGLTPYVMTTGSRGVHVVVPLDQGSDFDAVRDFAKGAAAALASRHPDALTTEQRKSKRNGRLYLDVMRNAYGQTAVIPYSLRARPGAPVATPLAWDELASSDLHARRYHIGNVFRRLGQRDDPWADMRRHAAGLAAASEALDALSV